MNSPISIASHRPNLPNASVHSNGSSESNGSSQASASRASHASGTGNGAATLANLAEAEYAESSKLAETAGIADTVRVIVADSHGIFRLGISRILEQHADLRVVAEAETYGETLAAALQSPAEVLLFEAQLTGEVAQAVSAILAKAPRLRIIVVGDMAPAAQTLEMLRRGAQGVVDRSIEPEMLVKCVRCVAAGEPWLSHQITHWLLGAYRNLAAHSGTSNTRLTPKEVFIANCVVQGMRNKDIAEEAHTTEQVVKNYLRKIFHKVQVSDRMELAMYLVEHPIQDGIPLDLDKKDVSARPVVELPKPKVAAAAAGR